ncbi:MAG: 4Fe-4S dicluster domain-containing protein [Rhodospirillaceae bacterium]
MKLNDWNVLVCDCEGTMAIDAGALGKACGGDAQAAHQLCRAGIDIFENAARSSDRLLVACTQEAPLFVEAAEGIEAGAEIRFCNIREKAGWCAEKPGGASRDLTAKMAALLAEASLEIPDAPSVAMESGGELLIVGPAETAVAAAGKVAERLDVTVLITDPGADDLPPRIMTVPVFKGRVTGASGHFGAFELSVSDFEPASPSTRSGFGFDGVGDKGRLECDLILDLRGSDALFTAHEKRDGYFKSDPANPGAVAETLLELIELVGTFDKPRYVDYDAALCAHGNSGIVGCSRCLDNCPTGAITPAGDKVAYDPFVCAGCGTCASICPTGAAKYMLPAGDALYARLRTLLTTYRKAGGKAPRLLIHDGEWGEDLIALLARHGDGLPANTIPFAVNAVTQPGLELLLAAAAYGAAGVSLLAAPHQRGETQGLEGEIALANRVLDGLGYGDGRIRLFDDADPDALAGVLREAVPDTVMPAAEFLAMGRKRSIMAQALKALHESAPNPVEAIALEAGAPFGAVVVDTAGCTLCLACVGACPTGALKDNPDKPQLSFAEAQCVQCGLCKNTCPEKVISLEPRLNFTAATLTHQVVKEEEPFQCIRCGKDFGTRSTIERMVQKLENHPMFQSAGGTDRLKMCEDCRVIAIATDDAQPMAFGTVPVTRTTEDYIRERDAAGGDADADLIGKPKGEA